MSRNDPRRRTPLCPYDGSRQKWNEAHGRMTIPLHRALCAIARYTFEGVCHPAARQRFRIKYLASRYMPSPIAVVVALAAINVIVCQSFAMEAPNLRTDHEDWGTDFQTERTLCIYLITRTSDIHLWRMTSGGIAGPMYSTQYCFGPIVHFPSTLRSYHEVRQSAALIGPGEHVRSQAW